MSQRYGYEIWSGLAMLVVAIAVASPVLLGAVEPSIDRTLWTSLFVVFLLNLGAAVSGMARRVDLIGFCAAVVFSWVLVLTAPGMGLLNVLLVLTAAISAYLVPVWGGFALVGINTVVLAVDAVQETAPSGDGALPDAALMEVGLFLGFYLMIQVATLLSTVTLIREQRQRRELARAHVDLRAASAVLAVNARAAERLRISRDLHDTIGHQLTVLALELEAARHRTPGPEREHVERAGSVARELLADLRATVEQLRTEPTDLARALEEVVADLPGLHVELDVEPEISLDEARTEALVRAVQEITTNTLRHADATRLWITVGLDGRDGRLCGDVVLAAEDDGCGPRDAGAGGNGLRGIAERFELLGGTAEFGTAAPRIARTVSTGSTARGRDPVGQGFRVVARVPSA
ncbi:two-component sensor histidine kinase [Citricoccus zhacaiensis]|uniref:histidine kinase n=1 Tax=Citricoccus zhacaiensis TaxID=489142 RepID=A0ABQ2M839_9MICC|nr:histidine kinase [Citricoccus zhacaiensis]GGO48374.1 two-component sensor histidine kinase [Citricoccus zhacaiensis]